MREKRKENDKGEEKSEENEKNKEEEKIKEEKNEKERVKAEGKDKENKMEIALAQLEGNASKEVEQDAPVQGEPSKRLEKEKKISKESHETVKEKAFQKFQVPIRARKGFKTNTDAKAKKDFVEKEIENMWEELVHMEDL